MHKCVAHQYIDIKVIAGHLYIVLSAHEGEPGSHLDKELLDMFYQAQLHIPFVILVRECKHIEDIGVFQCLFHLLGLNFGESGIEVMSQCPMDMVVILIDGFNQKIASLTIFQTLNHIPVTCFEVFYFLHQYDVVRPTQMHDRKV